MKASCLAVVLGLLSINVACSQSVRQFKLSDCALVVKENGDKIVLGQLADDAIRILQKQSGTQGLESRVAEGGRVFIKYEYNGLMLLLDSESRKIVYLDITNNKYHLVSGIEVGMPVLQVKTVYSGYEYHEQKRYLLIIAGSDSFEDSIPSIVFYLENSRVTRIKISYASQ